MRQDILVVIAKVLSRFPEMHSRIGISRLNSCNNWNVNNRFRHNMYCYKDAENRYFTKYLRYRYRILYLVFRTWFRYQRGQCLCKGKRKKDTSCSGYSECIKSQKGGICLCKSKAFCLTCISNNLFHRRRIVEIQYTPNKCLSNFLFPSNIFLCGDPWKGWMKICL